MSSTSPVNVGPPMAKGVTPVARRLPSVMPKGLRLMKAVYRGKESSAKICGDLQGGHVCTKVRGHLGEHVAHGVASEYARWPNEEKKCRT